MNNIDKHVRVDIKSYNKLREICEIKGWTVKKGVEMAVKNLEIKVKSEPKEE